MPVVQACIVGSWARGLTASYINLVLLHLLLLLNDGLDEGRLAIQVDSVLILQIVNVVV